MKLTVGAALARGSGGDLHGFGRYAVDEGVDAEVEIVHSLLAAAVGLADVAQFDTRHVTGLLWLPDAVIAELGRYLRPGQAGKPAGPAAARRSGPVRVERAGTGASAPLGRPTRVHCVARLPPR